MTRESLDLDIVNSGGIDRLLWSGGSRRAFTASTLWFVDFEVDSRVVFGADHAEQSAERVRGVSLTANDLAHVSGIDVERDEHAHFVDRAIAPDIFRMIYHGFDDVLDKFLVLLHTSIQRLGMLLKGYCRPG